MNKEIIFTDGDFTLVKESGTGMNNTPYEQLSIISDGLAYKHAIEIRVMSDGIHRFEGEPVHYKYADVYVAHGMRSARDTFSDTEEYIECLKNALAFAKRVYRFIHESDEWRA